MKKNLQRGFSLIELLVVVAIIGVLAAAGIYAYSKYLDSTKADTTLNNLSVLNRAMVADHASLSGGTTGTSDIVRGTSSTSTCHDIAVTMVRTINSDRSVVNPYFPKDANAAAAYGNALIQTGQAIKEGAVIISCFKPTATPSDSDYRLYACSCPKSNTPCEFDGPLNPIDSKTIPADQCPRPPVGVVGTPAITDAYALPVTP